MLIKLSKKLGGKCSFDSSGAAKVQRGEVGSSRSYIASLQELRGFGRPMTSLLLHRTRADPVRSDLQMVTGRVE